MQRQREEGTWAGHEVGTDAEGLRSAFVAFAPPDPALPFWDRPALPAEVSEQLSDAPIYLLFDAPRRIALKGVFDLDNLAGSLRAACLSDKAEQAQVAPWLVGLDLRDSACVGLLHDVFDTGWGQGAALLIQCDAEWDDLRRHLRGLMRVRKAPDAKETLLFRYWDPRIAGPYLASLKHRPERAARMLRLEDGTAMTWVVENGALGADLFTVPPAGEATHHRMVAFDAQDHEIFQTLALAALGAELTDWLRRDYGQRFSSMTPEQTHAMGAHILRTGEAYGCKLKDEFALLAHAMTEFGGWFHASGLYPNLTDMLATEMPGRHRKLRGAFDADWRASHRPAMVLGGELFLEEVMAEAGAPRLRADRLKALVTRHLGGTEGPAGRLAHHAATDPAYADLAPPQRVAVALLTLFLGYRFDADPLRPWAGSQDVDGVIDSAWRSILREAF